MTRVVRERIAPGRITPEEGLMVMLMLMKTSMAGAGGATIALVETGNWWMALAAVPMLVTMWWAYRERARRRGAEGGRT